MLDAVSNDAPAVPRPLVVDRPVPDEQLKLYNEIKNLVQVKVMEQDKIYVQISDIVQKSQPRLDLSVNFLNEVAPGFAKRLLNDPVTFLPPIEEAINDVARQLHQLQDSKLGKTQSLAPIRVGIKGWLGSHSITPRGIKADLANKVILVEGIVTRCTPPASRLKMAAFFIPDLNRHMFREYADKYALVPDHKLKGLSHAVVTSDADGRAVELEYGLSEYKDYQWLTLQEMPEITPLGQLPRSIDVLADFDLVDKVKPGDRTRVCGVLRTFTHCNSSVVSGGTSVCLVANHVQQLQIDHMARKVEPSMIKLFKELANDPNTLELVAASIAPAISGHRRVRQGLALQLAGGVTQDAPDGLRRRGDIHVLLLGDPSCGKSQMLRYALRLAPLAVSATGRGSSAVGLTAAVTKDAATGHMRLEAGAMVLADRGMVCIDEFDKMGHDDRSAVHEVMEQQKVTIFKANISAVLNARTSVLAAANPIYGHFDDKVDFAKQINFPDSLLSRFDLIFLIRESATAAQDRKIAQQVLTQLRAIKRDALEDTKRQRAMRADVTVPTLLQPRAEIENAERPNVPLKQLMWQHSTSEPVGRGKGKLSAEAVRSAKAARLLKPEFLKEYLIHCRFAIAPTLSEDAEEEIAEFYGYLRERIRKEWEETKADRAVPTPRLLEALIRLSTAHAKLKMKSVVDCDDVAAAKSLVLYTLLGAEDHEEEATAPESTTPTAGARGTKRNRRGAAPPQDSAELAELSAEIANIQIDEPGKRRKPEGGTAQLTEEVWSVIADLHETTREEDWSMQHLFKLMKKTWRALTMAELKACLQQLQSDNKVMVVGQRCYYI